CAVWQTVGSTHWPLGASDSAQYRGRHSVSVVGLPRTKHLVRWGSARYPPGKTLGYVELKYFTYSLDFLRGPGIRMTRSVMIALCSTSRRTNLGFRSWSINSRR